THREHTYCTASTQPHITHLSETELYDDIVRYSVCVCVCVCVCVRWCVCVLCCVSVCVCVYLFWTSAGQRGSGSSALFQFPPMLLRPTYTQMPRPGCRVYTALHWEGGGGGNVFCARKWE